VKVQGAPTAGAPRGVGRAFVSFQSYNFRLFWTGQLVSQIGTWMQTVAQSWLVLDLTHSALALGTVTALQFLPILATVLFAGLFVDRLPKQTVLLGTQSAFLAQAAVMAVLTASGHIALWHIYVLAFVLGLINALDSPARQAFVLELVGREHVVNAVGLSSAQFSSARLVGPAIGGLVIAAWGTAACFGINAISFLSVLLSLLLLRRHEFVSLPERTSQGNVLAELGAGVRFLLSRSDLAVALILLCGNGAFIYSTSTIIPLIAEDALHVGAAQFGLLVSAVGLGSLALAFVMASRGTASEGLVLGAAASFGVLYFSLAFTPSVEVALVQLALVGGSIQTFATSVSSLMQLRSPDHLRGRVMAVFTLLTNGIIPLGSLFNGVVTATAGVRFTLAGEASICLLALAVALAYRARARSRAASLQPA
jgi:predicted MFS family arabinose efflux permease